MKKGRKILLTHRPKIWMLHLDLSIPLSVVALGTVIRPPLFTIHREHIDAIFHPCCFNILLEFLEGISKDIDKDDFVNLISNITLKVAAGMFGTFSPFNSFHMSTILFLGSNGRDITIFSQM